MSLEARQRLVNSPRTIFQNDSQRSDFLDPNKTDTDLVQLFLDLIDKNHIIEFTAVNSDHHDDSALGPHSHRCKHAADCWPLRSTNPGDYLNPDESEFLRFCHDAGVDPMYFQEGLAGSAYTHAAIVATGRGVFQDDGGDHIHLGVI